MPAQPEAVVVVLAAVVGVLIGLVALAFDGVQNYAEAATGTEFDPTKPDAPGVKSCAASPS